MAGSSRATCRSQVTVLGRDRYAVQRSIVVATAAAALSIPLVALPAGQAGAQERGSWHITRVLTNHVVGPLQFDVVNHKVFVADSFKSILRRIGTPRVIARGYDPSKGGDISGVATDAVDHQMAYLKSNGDTRSPSSS